jgi:hypothetical protein
MAIIEAAVVMAEMVMVAVVMTAAGETAMIEVVAAVTAKTVAVIETVRATLLT